MWQLILGQRSRSISTILAQTLRRSISTIFLRLISELYSYYLLYFRGLPRFLFVVASIAINNTFLLLLLFLVSQNYLSRSLHASKRSSNSSIFSSLEYPTYLHLYIFILFQQLIIALILKRLSSSLTTPLRSSTVAPGVLIQ